MKQEILGKGFSPNEELTTLICAIRGICVSLITSSLFLRVHGRLIL